VTQWTGSFAAFSKGRWVDSLSEIEAALASRGIGLVWMHDPPTLGSDPVDYLGIRDEVACTPSRFAVAADTAFHADVVERTLSAAATFVNPLDALCDDTTCALRLGGNLVYRDDNHLTAKTARSLTTLIEPAILKAIGVG
jgi:hypothetical protein